MSQLSKKIIKWHKEYGRKNLPWQRDTNPYKVWISEIMLQQTQVNTVIPYYQRFIERFPDIEALANSTEEEVLSYWSGLGYYSRGRNIFKSARLLKEQFNCSMPSSLELLESLPGVGRSTAGAIRSLGFKKQAAILDGNAKRLLVRYFCIEETIDSSKTINKLWEIAEAQVPAKDCNVYTQAIMDVGSLICKRTNPQCEECPLEDDCLSKQQGMQTLLPNKSPKKRKPLKKVYWMLIQNEREEILLENRNTKGIWEGLWSFPEFKKKAERQDYIKSLKKDYELIEKDMKLKHSFSHYDLDIDLMSLKVSKMHNLENNKAWFGTRDIMKVGIPAPVSKILKK